MGQKANFEKRGARAILAHPYSARAPNVITAARPTTRPGAADGSSVGVRRGGTGRRAQKTAPIAKKATAAGATAAALAS